jgi:hypothetical protein
MTMQPRYAIVQGGKITGVVNWDGVEEHLYGDVDLRGPVPENAELADLLGKRWEDSLVLPDIVVKGTDTAVFSFTDEKFLTPYYETEPALRRQAPRRFDFPTPAQMNNPSPVSVGESNVVTGYLKSDPVPHPTAPATIAEAAVTRSAAQRLLEANPPWFTFKAEAKRILGEDMPEKKADIILALKEKADG